MTDAPPPTPNPRVHPGALHAPKEEDAAIRAKWLGTDRAKLEFAWTPGCDSYAAYPPFVNVKSNGDGSLCLTVRGTEQRVKTGMDNGFYWKQGETVSVVLPPDAASELVAALRAAAGGEG